MNNKHCDIIKDLLPLYADGLTSEESNEAVSTHLATCENCAAIYETLEASSEVAQHSTGKELDYLKKIKAKRKKLLLITIGICIVVFGILTAIGVKTFIIGTPIAFQLIDGDATDEYTGIGTKFDPKTNELTLYGELMLSNTAFSGIKVEDAKGLAYAYNVTVYGAERLSDTQEYNRKFEYTIKIPDDNNIWSVYSIGEIPQDTYLIWSNAEQMAEKYAMHQQALLEHLSRTKGLSSENGWLEWEGFGEYGGENCHAFGWRPSWNDESNLILHYAVSEDGKRIYEYDNAKNTFVMAKLFDQPKVIDATALYNVRTKP